MKIMNIGTDRKTIIPGRIAETAGGSASHSGENPYFIHFRGSGNAVFRVNSPKEEECLVTLAYYLVGDPAFVKLTCNGKSICQTFSEIEGGYASETVPMRDRYMMQAVDTGKLKFEGVLELKKGNNEIHIDVQTRGDFRLTYLEIMPKSALPAIEAEIARADKLRQPIAPLVAEGYGIFVHWTPEVTPRHGNKKPYEQAVNDFDTEKFAEQMSQMGANYVVFTTNHGFTGFPAPLKVWEKYHPGQTTKRDLIADLITSLKKRKIKLFIYLHVELMGRTAGVRGGKFSFPDEEMQDIAAFNGLCDRICNMLEEIGNRYGEDVHGYWFDSYKYISLKYGIDPSERIYKATKIGNPKRVTSLSYGVRCPNITPWQDYGSGENRAIGKLPVNGKYINGQHEGLPYHSIIILDDNWAHVEYDNPIADPQYSSNEMSTYIKGCMERGGLVSVNVAVYQDGSAAPLSVEVMKETAKIVYGSK